MKKLLLMLFVIQIAAICILSASAVSVVEMIVDEEDGAYTLSVVGRCNGNINTAEVMLSYDNEVIIPTDAQDGADVFVFSSAIHGISAPLSSEMSLAPVQWIVEGSTTTVKVTAYSITAMNASDGITFMKFHFRVAEGKTVSADTFTVARADIVEQAYGLNDVSNAAAISFGDDAYALPSGMDDTILFGGIDLSGVSDNYKILTGDITPDGSINTADAIAMFKMLAYDTAIFTKNQMKAADCVADGQFNVMDAIKLMQYLASDEVELD